MNSLVEKLKESRRQTIQIEGFTFRYQRPTALDMEDYAANMPHVGYVVNGDGNMTAEDRRVYNDRWRYGRQRMLAFVCDWPGMRELDIIPGGTGAALPFDSDLFMAWVSDQPYIADQLATAIITSWNDRNAAIEAAQKKPNSGTSPESSLVSAAEN